MQVEISPIYYGLYENVLSMSKTGLGADNLRSKKVLILNHYQRLSPRVTDQINTLLQLGVHIVVFCWSREAISANTSPIRYDQEIINLPAPRGRAVLVFYLPLLYAKMFIRAIRYSCDVVHCTHLVLLPLAVVLGKLRRARVVYDDYDFYSIMVVESLPRAIQPVGRLLIGLAERLLMRFVDLVFVIDTADDYLLEHHARFAQNVIPLSNYPPLVTTTGNSKAHGAEAEEHSCKVLAYIGGISDFKGSFVLLESLCIVRNSFPNIKLRIIGDFANEEQRQRFLRKIEDFMLERNIELREWMPYETMLRYLQDVDIGLALYQPMGRYLISRGNARKIYTYMSCGIPVIGPHFGQIGKVIEVENCGILVDTTDSQQIAEAAIFLLSFPHEARRLGMNGRKAIEQRYNWELESRTFAAAYKGVLQD